MAPPIKITIALLIAGTLSSDAAIMPHAAFTIIKTSTVIDTTDSAMVRPGRFGDYGFSCDAGNRTTFKWCGGYGECQILAICLSGVMQLNL